MRETIPLLWLKIGKIRENDQKYHFKNDSLHLLASLFIYKRIYCRIVPKEERVTKHEFDKILTTYFSLSFIAAFETGHAVELLGELGYIQFHRNELYADRLIKKNNRLRQIIPPDKITYKAVLYPKKLGRRKRTSEFFLPISFELGERQRKTLDQILQENPYILSILIPE